jgi:hypothetical protein
VSCGHDTPVPGCPDCRAHERIAAALPEVGADLSPRPGWEARVLAAVTAPERRVRWWWIAAPAALAAAAALVLWLGRDRGPSGPRPLEVALTVRRDGPPVRATTAAVGDVVGIEARGGRGHRAVWVYRDDRELVLRCPGGATCAIGAGGITAELRVERAGRYAVVLLAADQPLPAPTGRLDDDLAAAAAAGATRQLSELDVR